MSALRERQARWRAALLGGEAAPAVHGIAGDGLSPDARLAIYRHHVRATLTDVLASTYPVTCRLVDERFFGYAAARFVAIHPPSGPCLGEYGDAFPGFLASFEPCRALVYLADVARLEWAMSLADRAEDATPVDPRALVGCPAAELDGLRLRLHPSLTLLESPWPIDRIWRANQPDADPLAVVDLGTGGVRLEVRRRGDAAAFRPLEAGAFTLRRELHAGRTLGAAVEAALACEADLDLATTLRALFHDESVVAFMPATPKEDHRCKRCP